MQNSITFLTVALTAAITFVLHRIYEPNVWVGIGIAIAVATGVATVLVSLNALSIRFSQKKPPAA